MSDRGPETPSNNNQSITLSAEQFAEFLRLNGSQKSSNQEPSSHPESLGEVHIATKLDGDNYPIWAKLMRRAIGGKGLASHISGVPDPPLPTDPTYTRWQQRDDCCFNWIIGNIDASLVNEVSQYATAHDLWESLATTYRSGADQFQISDLHRQAYSLKQGNLSLENLWQKLQDLWISIDTRDPNPMDTPSSIEKYNQHIQRHRLYQFVWALDDQHDKIKREILNMDPIPTARKAYGMVRREYVNERLMNPASKDPGIGVGLGVFDRSRNPTSQNPPPPPHSKTYRREEDKSKMWWEEMKKARQNRGSNRNSSGGGSGRAAAAVAGGDRVAFTDTPVGSIGPPPTNGGEDKIRLYGGEKAVTSASVAR